MNSSLLKKSLPHIIAIAVFLVIAIVYCKPAFDGKVVSQSDVIGWKGMAQQSLDYQEKNGHCPLWSNSAFSGMPGYTFAMSSTSKISIGYIGDILKLGLPKPVYFFFLACLCLYILTQVLSINPWLGILASIAFSYNTFDPVLVAVGHDTQLLAIAYAPGVIAGFLLIFQRKYWLGAALLAILFGLQISSSHLQIIYYTAFTLGFITLFQLVTSWKQGQMKSFTIGLAISIAAAAIGFCTYAVIMFPLQEYAKETKRGGKSDLAHDATDKNKSKGGLDKDYAFQFSNSIGESLTMIVPGIFGGGTSGKMISDNSKFAEKATEIGMPEDYAIQMANGYSYWGDQPILAGPVYVGAVICFLAILGLVFSKSPHKKWLIAIAILGTILAWGKNFAAFNYLMFDYFPFYNKFRAPTQALFLVQLAMPLLAALGANELFVSSESKEEIWKKFRLSVIVTGAILVVLVGFYFMSDYKSGNDARIKDNFANMISQSYAKGKQPTPEMQQQAMQVSNGLMKGLQSDRQSIYGTDLIRTIFFIALAVALIGLYLKGKIKETILLAGLVLIGSYDLLAEGRKYLNEDSFVEPNEFESSFTPSQADLQINKDPEKYFRVFDQSNGGDAFQSSKASYFHNSLGGYSPAKLGLYQDIIDSQLVKGNMMVYNMLNTKYFIQRNPNTGQPQASLNPNAFGPCWLVKSILYVNNGNEEMNALDHVNVRDTAIVDKSFESAIKFQPEQDSTASIQLLDNKNDTIDYKFSSKKNQFAVFSEVYYSRGWNAYIDGIKTPYCKTDYILRGLSIPAGEHTIQFRFEPSIYRIGNTVSVWASIIAYLLLIAALFFEFKNQKKDIAGK